MLKKDVFNAQIKNIEGNIPDVTNVSTNSFLNARINEVKGEMLNITYLSTTGGLTALKSKIANVCNLVKKTEYNTKIGEIENGITTDHDHDKYITTQGL